MERIGYIGSSDAAPIIGISPFKSRLDVWLEKRGEKEADEASPAMMLGTYMEPFIRAMYEIAHGEHIVSVPQREHPEHPWMRTRLDGKVKGQPIAYEAKTARMPFDWGETIPPYYVPQVQHHLAVTGYDACRVVAMIGGALPLKVYTVERDEDYIRDLIEVESEFWFRNVIEGIQPEPDGNPAAEEFIRRRHPADTEPLRVATPEEYLLVQEWHAAKAALDAQERTTDELRQKITARIGDAAGIEGPGFRVTWKKNKDSIRVGWEQVADSLRTMIDEATRDGRFQHRPGDPGFDEIVSLYTAVKEGPRVFRASIEEIA